MKEQLNNEEAARLLGLSPYTIRAYVSRRRIPFRKIGARVVFDIDELEEWLRTKAVEPIGTGKAAG